MRIQMLSLFAIPVTCLTKTEGSRSELWKYSCGQQYEIYSKLNNISYAQPTLNLCPSSACDESSNKSLAKSGTNIDLCNSQSTVFTPNSGQKG